MLIIGEKINGMFKNVKQAIIDKDAVFIENLAKAQIEAGAKALDICVGPIKGDAKEHMKWLVNIVSSAVDVPLCIDSPHPDVIEVGVNEASGKTIINSLKQSPESIEKLIPLAKKNNSEIICLLMNENGIPVNWADKLQIAAELLVSITEAGIDSEKIYFDPILLPVTNAQKDVAEIFELIEQISMLTSPSPHIIVGLSNLSQQAKYRSLLERIFCTMAMSHGLDAAIINPLDKKLIKAIKTANILLNQELYAPSYLKA